MTKAIPIGSGDYMIRVAICDDMPELTGMLEGLVNAYDDTLFAVSVFFSADTLLASLQEQEYDCFILDIELPQASGIEIAKIIREQDVNVPIVFLTSFAEYMEEVFQVQTFDYLLKPVTKEKLFPVLKKVIAYLDLDDGYFSFTYKRAIYNVKLTDILYFEKQRRAVVIHTKKHDYQAVMSTSDLLKKLNQNFVQVHTSYIVNVNFIREIGANQILLAKEPVAITIPISRKYRTQARDQIIMKLRSKL